MTTKFLIFAKKIGVSVFRGSEDDVMQRYIEAARKFKIRNIIRLTSDNPMIDHSIIDSMINIFESNNMTIFLMFIKELFLMDLMLKFLK